MLGLTSKNFYGIVLTYISWIHNLFRNLTTIYAWNNYVSSKATKFRKLITWATDIKIQIRKNRYKAHNSDFDILPLYVLDSGWQRWWWWLKSRPPRVQPKVWRQGFLTTQGDCSVVVPVKGHCQGLKETATVSGMAVHGQESDGFGFSITNRPHAS